MKPAGNQKLERILESAIVVSWANLMRGAPAGLIHIEYGCAANGTLDYLKVLSSIGRGHWLLACEYWMSASKFHSAGLHFENGYESGGLAHILEIVMQHQGEFSLPQDFGWQGLLQILTPTQEETAVATTQVDQALSRIGSTVAVTAAA